MEGHVIGALGIYASEPDAFDEGEANLLSNLAENLSYGVASIRVAEQRRRSEEELRVYASRLEVINQEYRSSPSRPRMISKSHYEKYRLSAI